MKRQGLLLVVCMCIVMAAVAQPVKQHGRLSVQGTQLMDEHGKPVVLRGMSFGWHNYWPLFYNKQAVQWLASDWQCSVVRAAMGVEPDGAFIKNPVESEAKVDAVVQGAVKAGIYVIIDWHSHNIRTPEAIAFFTAMAKKYGDLPNVIYEIFNEPDEESWKDVKAYSSAVIAAIRAVDKDNLILVGNPHWDQDIHTVADDPIIGETNIMYTLHYYAGTHKQWLRDRADKALQQGIPIFISESAGMEATGDGGLDNLEWKRWIDWSEARKISWITWSVSDKDETCSVLKAGASGNGHWKVEDLKPSGVQARAFIKAYNSAAQAGNVLQAAQLLPYGRTQMGKDGLELISSAAHFAVAFEGESCTLLATINDVDGHNYLQYEVDGVYQKRLRIDGNNATPIIIGATGKGRHTLRLYKATEAHTGSIFIQQVIANNITSVPITSIPLIEFIGNSITCGAAADPSEVPCGTGAYHDQHNAYYAYGPRVARALNTQYLLSSVSGIGIYRNWNSDGPTMPQVYEKSNFQADGQAWDFSTYTPRVVSIALGTNDFSNGDGKRERKPFDSATFVSNYIRFVQLVKSKYPAAQIALLSSPMMNGDKRTLLQNCISAVKAAIDANYPKDKPVAVHFFQPMQAHGCTGHPNVEDHAVMAAELVPFFRGLL